MSQTTHIDAAKSHEDAAKAHQAAAALHGKSDDNGAVDASKKAHGLSEQANVNTAKVCKTADVHAK